MRTRRSERLGAAWRTPEQERREAVVVRSDGPAPQVVVVTVALKRCMSIKPIGVLATSRGALRTRCTRQEFVDGGNTAAATPVPTTTHRHGSASTSRRHPVAPCLLEGICEPRRGYGR